MTSTGDELPDVTDDVTVAAKDLARYGCARLSGALPDADVSLLRERTLAAAAADRDMSRAYLYSDDQANQRVWTLIGRDPVFLQAAQCPAVLEVLRSSLGENLLVSNFSANITGPGGTAMLPHWDQDWADRPWPLPLAAHAIWMLDDFTAENGATLVVPGSHLLDGPPPEGTPMVPATGPTGTVLFLDGRTWHGTGPNTSTSSGRIGILGYYCRPYIRQQENYALSLTPEFQRTLNPDQRTLLGLEFYEYLNMVGGPPAGLPLA